MSAHEEGHGNDQILLKIANQLRDKTVNFCIIVQDDAESKWTFTNAEWAIGVFKLIETNIQCQWENKIFEGEEQGEDWDGRGVD